MFLYKLKKVLRERKKEVIHSVLSFSLMCSILSLFFVAFLSNDNFSNSDKKQMFVISVILTVINFTIIYYVDYFFKFNIICSLLFGYFVSFCLFLIPTLLFILYFEIDDLELNKDEIREAKLNKVFRNLF
jgi:hypothetical protein